MNSARIRNAILTAARKVFLTEGYMASMDKIAAEAYVARRSIFNIFGSKDNLFSAVLSEAVSSEVDTSALDPKADVETALRRFAEGYCEAALSEENVQLSRLVSAEYERIPQLIGGLTKGMMSQMLPPLAAYFTALQKDGKIVDLDAEMAAERFLASVLGSERARLALGGEPTSKARRKRYVDETVRQFVHGLYPRPSDS